jgi:alpha-glucosidase
MSWLNAPSGVLAFAREPGFACVVNLSDSPVPLTTGRALVASGPLDDGKLPADTAVWLRT